MRYQERARRARVKARSRITGNPVVVARWHPDWAERMAPPAPDELLALRNASRLSALLGREPYFEFWQREHRRWQRVEPGDWFLYGGYADVLHLDPGTFDEMFEVKS